MTTTKDATSVLNGLIETCLDGQNGFAAAAQAVDDAKLRSELSGYSTQRAGFAGELKNLVASAGESPTQSGSVAAALHRGWIKLKDAISTNDRYAILAECERGEDSAVAEYKKATAAGLPAEYARVIQTQFAAVQRTHDRVRAMRDAAKK